MAEIAEMPAFFNHYLRTLRPEQAMELLLWVEEAHDDNAVLECILEAANHA